MSPNSRGRRMPSLILMLLTSLVLGGGFALASPASAESRLDHNEVVTYDCMSGQTVTLQPGTVYSMNYSAETGEPVNTGIVNSAAVVINDNGNSWRQGIIAEDGHSVSFLPYYIDATSSQQFKVTIGIDDTGSYADYSPSTTTCEGTPTDTDGDGVPDDLDLCPDTPPGATVYADGCPPRAADPQLSIISTTAAHDGTTDGSVTFTVTNTADELAAAATYTVSLQGGATVASSLGPVADGATSSQVTFASAWGEFTLCASGSDDSYTCTTVSVPRDTTPGKSATVNFQNRCGGVYTTITNTGWLDTRYEIWIREDSGQVFDHAAKVLVPGESLSLLSGRYFNFRAQAFRDDGTEGFVLIGQHRWTVPDDCTPMRGGSKLQSWGPHLTRRDGMPNPTVRTIASHTKLGFRVKGDRVVHWVKTVSPGKHQFALSRVPRHSQRCFKIVVAYTDGFTVVGRTAITDWHCYRRP